MIQFHGQASVDVHDYCCFQCRFAVYMQTLRPASMLNPEAEHIYSKSHDKQIPWHLTGFELRLHIRNQPLNYCFCCRPTISHDITIQIEQGTVLESPALWLEGHLFGFQGSLLPKGLPSVRSSTDERDFVQKRLPSFYRSFYRNSS